MRHTQPTTGFCGEQRIFFHAGRNENCWPNSSRPFLPWQPRIANNCSTRFFPPNIASQVYPLTMASRIRPTVPNPLALQFSKNQYLRPKRKPFVRTRFKYYRRRNESYCKVTLNPNDPLNLQDLMKETERRRVEGLSPLRGDSRMNTPATSVTSDNGAESPMNLSKIIEGRHSQNTRLSTFKRQTSGNIISNRFINRSNCRNSGIRKGQFLPITGNYVNYYVRRDPSDRLSYLMPEWFVGKDIADYGCHNGTFTFGVLERFPDLKKIDAFDCDAELIANARSMQRERIRWDTGSFIKFDKINFQIGNWIEGNCNQVEPEYDTIMAFSVTKWIHLNYGDSGLMRFFRKAFSLLKPGGYLILEPQPKSSYRKTRFSVKHRENYQSLKIDPSKLEPILMDLGFSYFDTIKAPRPNEPFKRKIILCSKSYGATPASIRNNFRSEFQQWEGLNSPQSPRTREPPPVCYHPQTPIYHIDTPVSLCDSPLSNRQHHQEFTSVEESPETEDLTPLSKNNSEAIIVCEPDSTSNS